MIPGKASLQFFLPGPASYSFCKSQQQLLNVDPIFSKQVSTVPAIHSPNFPGSPQTKHYSTIKTLHV
jgi:hypothetical protein